MVCENYSSLKNGEDLLSLLLEIGFRHLNREDHWLELGPTHTEHHQVLAKIIFESGDSEAIADLLYAWTSRSNSHESYASLKICMQYLVGLHHLYPFSPRLHYLIAHTIVIIGYQEFKQVGVEVFFKLVDDLQAHVEESDKIEWTSLLLDIIQSTEGIQHLSLPHWELLVVIIVSYGQWLEGSTYSPQTMISLKEAEEWDKLECWIGVVWMLWPREGETAERDLRNTTLALFHQRPGAVQKLEQWMEQWADEWRRIPESFQQICKQAHDGAAQQAGL